jgi:hypothetical protein
LPKPNRPTELLREQQLPYVCDRQCER